MNLLTELSNYLKKHDLKICTAESCTGGMIASCLTELPGSSEWFTMGFVTYTLEMKSKFLGVEKNFLHQEGPINAYTVEKMAQGALRESGADIALSTSGLAGPDSGGNPAPIGTVWFACADKNGVVSKKEFFRGNRADIRLYATQYSLYFCLQFLKARYLN